MSNLILSGVKAVGQTLINTAGRIGLAYANQAITNAFDNRVFEGPRLDSLHIQSSRDGSPMARIYGKARIAGQVIWAARVREVQKEEPRSGKGGGARTRNYSYTLSFAVGLCEGEILGVDRIWANGEPLALRDLNTRLYLGTQDQGPDPLISEVEDGPVPAFRGTAYMVFEDIPIDEFGARLPQLNFEVTRLPPRNSQTPRLEDLVTGINLIPGSGEFVYSSTLMEERLGPGTSRALNMNNVNGSADMDVALDQLQAQLPNCSSVTLLVSWFGNDLRAGHCAMRPGVESNERIVMPHAWQVGNASKSMAVSENAPALTFTRRDTQERLKDVRLSYIDPGRDYQAGTVYARDQFAETVRILDIQAPLMLGPAQAKHVASSLLARNLNETSKLEFLAAPSQLALEVGDVVKISGDHRCWQITQSAGDGAKNIHAQQIGTQDAFAVNGSEPGILELPIWVSAPEGFVIDIVNFSGNFIRKGPLVGAILNPWLHSIMNHVSGVDVALENSVRIGALLSEFSAGPSQCYDNGPSIDVYLPGVFLSSLTDEDMLAGGNKLAVETSQGWEVFQCQNAVLISDHTYRLSRFFRGLFGTDIKLHEPILAGARIIDLSDGWAELPLDLSLRGSDVELELAVNGRPAPQLITVNYSGTHLRPLSPVHAKAMHIGDIAQITWIRRTRIGGDDWVSFDVPLGEEFERYEVEFITADMVLAVQSTTETALDIPMSELENYYGGVVTQFDVNIYQISQSYGRGTAGRFTLSI